MTDNIKNKLAYLKSEEYKKYRRNIEKPYIIFPEGTSEININKTLFRYMLDSEAPILFENDIFGFNRTVIQTPIGVLGDKEYNISIGNITPNYSYTLSVGMDVILERIKDKYAVCGKEKRELYEAMIDGVEGSLALADSYREYAREKGNKKLYDALSVVPHKAATGFYEACVFLKFIQFTLRLNRNAHITLGGFDKYMLPYFESDIARGVKEEEIFEIIEEFFITLNMDSDTYFGIQKGDNGMSVVLGGRDINNVDRYNKISEMCLCASRELCLIDPKINLRVDKDTPIERLELASTFTAKGLGFPQYSNDDVVIPGLIELGYPAVDAYDYTVAACWEFIIPEKGYDIPNIASVNFPLAVSKAIKSHLSGSATFDEFLEKVKICIENECELVAKRMVSCGHGASPYMSVFVTGCIEKGLDVSQGGAIYNNYGAHGVGISSAADSIAAVKKAIFDDGKCTKEELLSALDNDFKDNPELRNYLVSAPKMGNNDNYVDVYASMIIDIFSKTFSKYKNLHGGILRPGTGSAMEYLWQGREVGATPDGRYAYTPFGSSYSPSPIAKLNGPLSCIQSFTKQDLKKAINGGPLTMEIHENVFRNDEGTKKVAALVRAFIQLGGHQLQLNAISRDTLLDAQKHPERHKNLIVRVWGWSGYFNDLDVEFQNHIISRTEFMA